MTSLERAAWRAWRQWGSYAKYTLCDGECGEQRYCRSARRRIWLCLQCWDQREGRRQ